MGTYAVADYFLYILILIVVYWFFIKFILPKINIDKKFLLAILPFIFFGVFVRVLADISFFQMSKLWSITPGVYILAFTIAVISIIFGRKIEELIRVEYWFLPFIVGSIFSVYLLFLLLPYFKFPERMLHPLLLTFSITFLIFFISYIAKIKIYQKIENLSVVFAHLLDASSTFIAYNFFGFGEEHILTQYFITLAGNNAGIMIPIKLLLVLLFLYFLEKYEKKEKQKVIKLLIFILGIGPGLRNTILPSLLF
ncbi:MAG: DUF63 family protein [Candidatus Altiarchaeota archaeon]